jgi:hypothetical protein
MTRVGDAAAALCVLSIQGVTSTSNSPPLIEQKCLKRTRNRKMRANCVGKARPHSDSWNECQMSPLCVVDTASVLLYTPRHRRNDVVLTRASVLTKGEHMKRLVFVVTLVFLSLQSAQGSPVRPIPNVGGGNVQGNLLDDGCTIPTGCAAWPSDPTTGDPTGASTCGKKTSYKSCLEVCTCEHNKLKKKCKNGIACLHTAQVAKDVCDTGCLTDFTP